MHDEQMRANQLNKLRRIVDFLEKSYEDAEEYERAAIMIKIRALLDQLV